MRRFFYSCLLLVFFSTVSNSQNIVLNVGVNISNMSVLYSADVYSTDKFPIFAPDFGLNYEHAFNETFSIKPGIAFSRQGRLIAMDLGSGFYYEEKFTINYIDLPLLFSYNFNPRTTWGYSLNINVGPYIGYGFNGVVTSDNTAFVSEDGLFIGPDGVHRNDYGLIFRVGFGYPENQVSVSLNTGLKNLAKYGGDYTKFKRIGIAFNYIKVIDFGPNARRMLRKRFF